MLALRIKKAVRNGATLVVADPRKIWLTKLAKRHLQVRPGTDVWLINAMMHTILEEGLQDEEYIREHTDGLRPGARGRLALLARGGGAGDGRPGGGDPRDGARVRGASGTPAIFYTLGITEHACGVDNIWSLSNLVLMTGHLGYESTGLNALRGQNNVQGLNDSGANPSYLPGYQPVDDPEIRREVLGGVGRRGARGAGLPARPDRLGPPRRPRQGALPRRREPGADRAERPPRRGGPRALRVHRLAGHLPERLDAEVRGRRPAGVELRREGRDVHEHRAAREPRAEALDCPGEAREDWRIVCDLARALGASWPEYAATPKTCGTSSPTSRPNWYGIRYDADRGAGDAVAVHRPRPSGHAVPAFAGARRCRRAGDGSSRSSTSRRSSSPTRSTRSCSPPAGRSTTTTRRR